MRSRKDQPIRQSRRHVRHLRHLLPGLLLCWAVFARAADSDPATRVVLLANSADPDSLRVAQHYAAARGVPVANIIALPMPVAETITWREFVATIWQPLEDELIRTKWIDAIPMALTDAVGRKKNEMTSHPIATPVG